FDRPEDHWPRKWAEAYVAFAAGEMRPWLRQQGMTWFPVVGWAERGGYGGFGHGNSGPRVHITWGSGPAVVGAFVGRASAAAHSGTLRFRFRHRVDGLIVTNGTVEGVRGALLEPATEERGVPSSRKTIGVFELRSQAVIIASGGIGGDFELVRKNWPSRLGEPPRFMLPGVPGYVDGRLIEITENAGARVINRDRMWHYTEGLRNWNPIWKNHGIRVLPGPSSLWLDATGKRLPPPLYPGFDNLGALEHIMRTGYDYSWFVLNQKIIQKEFALSGSEQNPDFTGKNWRSIISRARARTATGPVEAFKQHGADFV